MNIKFWQKSGFTLIELLIVVAIIAILAAIAVPNFLEAQVRAKVSRVKNDLRSISVGIEMFSVDNNRYPIHMNPTAKPDDWVSNGWTRENLWVSQLAELTTPVAYMTTVALKDPFAPIGDKTRVNPSMAWVLGDASYFFVDYSLNPVGWTWATQGWATKEPSPLPIITARAYVVSSWGPDRTTSSAEWAYMYNATMPYKLMSTLMWPGGIYDSTNGTISGGDVARYGGEIAAQN